MVLSFLGASALCLDPKHVSKIDNKVGPVYFRRLLSLDYTLSSEKSGAPRGLLDFSASLSISPSKRSVAQSKHPKLHHGCRKQATEMKSQQLYYASIGTTLFTVARLRGGDNPIEDCTKSCCSKNSRVAETLPRASPYYDLLELQETVQVIFMTYITT